MPAPALSPANPRRRGLGAWPLLLTGCAALTAAACGSERILVARELASEARPSMDLDAAPVGPPMLEDSGAARGADAGSVLTADAAPNNAVPNDAVRDAGLSLDASISPQPCGDACFCEQLAGRRYMLCPQTIISQFAIERCHQNGMRLVQIDDAEENAGLRSLANEYGFQTFQLGAGDRATEGTWIWDDGQALWSGGTDGQAAAGAYVNWSEGAPDNQAVDQNCLAWSSDFEAWDDRHCASPAYQACESPDVNAQCLEDCACSEFNQHLYMICAEYANWQSNFELCFQSGMSMVRVESAEEDQFLWEQYAPTGGEGLWLGARDVAVEGIWTWNDGDIFFDDQAGTPVGGLYANFSGGQPDNFNREQDRLAMLPSGEWDDVHFRLAIPFVCEESPSD